MKRIVTLSMVVLFGLALAVSQLVWAAPPNKVKICHVDPDCDGEGPVIIEVSERALDAHLAHGDCEPDTPENWSKGDDCTDLCPDQPVCDDNGCDNPGVCTKCAPDCFCVNHFPDGAGNCVDFSFSPGTEPFFVLCNTDADCEAEAGPGFKCFLDPCFSETDTFCAFNCVPEPCGPGTGGEACGNPGACENCDSNPNPNCTCVSHSPDGAGNCVDLSTLFGLSCIDDAECECDNNGGPGYKCYSDPCVAGGAGFCALNCEVDSALEGKAADATPR